MGIANAYSRIIRRQLEQHAAWPPVTNVFALGDFGVVSNGIFTRMGNIADLGVTWKEKEGPPSKLDYKSTSVVTTRFEAGAKVDVFSDSVTIDAKLVFRFKRESTFVLKAPKITSREIDDVFAVAAKLHAIPSWRWRYRFVTRVYSAETPLIIANREGGTEVTISGKAAALKKIEFGDAAVDIGVTTDRHLSLEVTGQSGVIGLGLGRVRVAGAVGEAGQAGAKNEIGVEEDTDWDSDEVDDI